MALAGAYRANRSTEDAAFTLFHLTLTHLEERSTCARAPLGTSSHLFLVWDQQSRGGKETGQNGEKIIVAPLASLLDIYIQMCICSGGIIMDPFHPSHSFNIFDLVIWLLFANYCTLFT